MISKTDHEDEVDVEAVYWVYLLQVKGDFLYCGITTNLRRRIAEHQTGKAGARFTKARRPVSLIACWRVAGGRSTALKVEWRLKRLSRVQKLELVRQPELIRQLFETTLPDEFLPVPDSSSGSLVS